MKKGWKRTVRLVALVMVHCFVASLSIHCGQHDSVGHGPYLLSVPRGNGSYSAHVTVDFFLDEEVLDGELIGWIRGSGCPAWVTLCDAGVCEIVYRTWAGPVEEMFVVDAEDSYVFDSFLETFVPCYKDGGEWMQEPMSCQRLVCDQSEEDIEIIFEAECAASLLTEIEVEYFDERTPFKGCLY